MYRGSYIRTADGTVRPTLAGLLALGTYPQQFFPQLSITFTHYRGTTKASDAAGIRYTDTLTIEGPIPLLIEEATRKVQEASPPGALSCAGHFGTTFLISRRLRYEKPLPMLSCNATSCHHRKFGTVLYASLCCFINAARQSTQGSQNTRNPQLMHIS